MNSHVVVLAGLLSGGLSACGQIIDTNARDASAGDGATAASSLVPGGEGSVPESEGAPGDSGTYTLNLGDTIGLVPGSVDASSMSNECSQGVPPPTPSGIFSLTVVGQKGPPPADFLSASFSLPAPPVDTPTVLSVTPPSPGSRTQFAQGGGIAFSYTRGDPSKIDDGPFDSVVVTLLAVPAVLGDPMTARFEIHFDDGRVMDETFSGALYDYAMDCTGG